MPTFDVVKLYFHPPLLILSNAFKSIKKIFKKTDYHESTKKRLMLYLVLESDDRFLARLKDLHFLAETKYSA